VSFRARLLLVSLATMAVGLGALVVGGNLLLASRVHAETDQLLQARSDAQIAALHVSGDGVRVRKVVNDRLLDHQSWVLDGGRVIERPDQVSARLDAQAVSLGRQAETVTINGADDVRLRAQPVRARTSHQVVGAVVVGVSQESFERLQHVVLVGSIVIAGLVLAGGGLAIRSAIDGALRPVAQMTERARDWGAHDLDRRFDLGEPHDELTGLAATLDGLLARIAASRRHEQHFASEVAHELRTPLAGIRGRAELALTAQGPGGDAERREALRRVVDQVARLDESIDTLLAVARRELEPAAGTTDLAGVVREIDGVTVRGPAGLPLAAGDPAVVRQALAPLVDNAQRHARRQVTLQLSAGGGRVRVAVRDDGPGLDPTLGERAFEPGARGSEEPDGGAGLGLALARRLARACGGDVTIGPGPGGCFVLELPAVGSFDVA
jgi:signal transduction histidine kinase